MNASRDKRAVMPDPLEECRIKDGQTFAGLPVRDLTLLLLLYGLELCEKLEICKV
jgi:hypothetical protein